MEESQKQLEVVQQQNSAGQLQGEQINQEEEKYDLAEITISQECLYPVQINCDNEILKFLQSGILKGIENPKLRERFIKSITSERVSKVLKLSFYFILVSNFPECIRYEEEQEISQSLKKKLSKNYVKLFSTLPQPKDEIVNLIIFCLGYINHYLFYQLFPKQRDLFDLRFVFNCYHIMVFEFNGIFVSDFFIRMNIDKIFFQNKFLDYERVNKKNLLLQQQAKNKLKNKTFFGFQLSFPEINTYDGQQFTRQVQEKFKPLKKNVLNLQEDHLTNHISIQDKQAKIKNQLKDKRIKQIEESELKKISQLLSIQQNEGDQAFQSLPTRSQRTIQLMTVKMHADANPEQIDVDPNAQYIDDMKGLTQLQRKLLFNQQIAKKLVKEKAEEIFDKTQLKADENNQKEEQNYFANLQLNCNQISPTISDVLAYDNRTLPYAKKKMIRHAFETVNDKEDNLLSQLKQFSQSRKQKKETKNTQKSHKSIIDHFGLRPPPREYYQKHPKLDKMFKDMLDLNYVLRMNQESMYQLPSSLQMQIEQQNEWQNQIIEQEQNYQKQNQRQKVQENLQQVIENNQKYQLEKRPGYRKKYIYTKPLQYMKRNESENPITKTQELQEQQMKSMILQKSSVNFKGNPNSKIIEPISNFQSQTQLIPLQTQQQLQMQQSMLALTTKTQKLDTPANQNQNQILISEKSQRNIQFLPNIEAQQSQEDNYKIGFNNGGSQMSSPIKLANSQTLLNFQQKTFGDDSSFLKQKKGIQLQKSSFAENSSANHRTIEFQIHEIDNSKGRKGNYYEDESESMEQKILKNKQNNDFYNDKRREYKEKYKGFINNMSTDNNIDDILQNILHKRNQFNKNLKSKIKNL
ncbi:hypothetical protein TTHERM_00312310 (macronuclear) [Tetrahymena thermophila SB210]|uniref:Uncharacterized protein n=1 Tax=Tetrahymena thermophila (strain SB210) TaxID=312017 RepID=Q22KQ0_TETTS|nr:hypothetical protein TTHERM_00312310 [Tetrahymena thermophila SB210]EAR85749.2 hypothetical protein TTHERM_00312310 [Tetrahymena thermophila SB210]|eukprot:XP_001033412.2 hypothetical protein TTHERM_00312310 [Tetrahymena thermophila SB210]